MNVRPMPRDWHTRASWRAKQQRRDNLRRHIAQLARERYTAPVTIQPDPDGPRHMLELGQALGAFCTEPDCQGAHHARGLCALHLKRHYRQEAA